MIPRDVGLQTLEKKPLSCGIIGESAPILAEIMIWKSQFHSAIHTLGYPKAALFGFGLALVAYNMLAVVLAALRGVHSAQSIDEDLSLYYGANDIAYTYHGTMIAIPDDEWSGFHRSRPAAV